VLFENAVAPAPWTLPSHVSIFSASEAISHGVNHWGTAPPELEMMAETLRAAGYTTGAITGGGILHPKFGFSQGFDTFHYWPEENSRDEIVRGIKSAKTWIDSHRNEPFFLFFHTYEIHYPYRRRRPFFDTFLNETRSFDPATRIQMRKHGWQGLRYPGDFLVAQEPGSSEWHSPPTEDELLLVSALYDSGVAYADAKIGELMAALKELEPRRPTMIVVTSDHGEALGEGDNRAGHSYLEDYNIMVPLIIEFPDGRGAGRRIEQQVRLIDLLPTVLESINLDGSHISDGHSLMSLIADPDTDHPAEAWTYASSNNRGLSLRLANRTKYTFNNSAWSGIAGEERLIDLRTDPTESHDLAKTDPRASELRDRCRTTIDAAHSGYRLLIRNRGTVDIEGTLAGPWAGVSRAKSTAVECLTIDWRKGDEVTFTATAHCESMVYFEGLRDPRVEIALAVGTDGPDLTEAIDLDGLDNPVELIFHDGSWHRAEGPPTDFDIGARVDWRGLRPDFERGNPLQNSEVIDQLKALGYVE
jgi:arylsulfatase A-like enzyme